MESVEVMEAEIQSKSIFVEWSMEAEHSVGGGWKVLIW
ncbi:hypothetical protein PR003_g29069 [Phytophthora rubi]|uniref:Uncharacterized protein n=1 Tax=Phytophthora rubi TaxID=129364 RepID=A0A6A4BLV8_9STRA|nr:hypothetical protein PR003_g29069 [Phytophthora rubi]